MQDGRWFASVLGDGYNIGGIYQWNLLVSIEISRTHFDDRTIHLLSLRYCLLETSITIEEDETISTPSQQ